MHTMNQHLNPQAPGFSENKKTKLFNNTLTLQHNALTRLKNLQLNFLTQNFFSHSLEFML